jgi:hypothetical protein
MEKVCFLSYVICVFLLRSLVVSLEHRRLAALMQAAREHGLLGRSVSAKVRVR